MRRKNWELFFEEEAARYDDNEFTKNTAYEIEFIVGEFGLKPGQEILDVGCGTGRHSIGLARKGFAVTGIDQSVDQLAIARSKTEKEKLRVDFIQGDASRTVLDRKFDHAICVCEGAFSLIEEGVEPIRYHMDILSNVNRMLRPGGKFLLTALNGFRFIRKSSDEDVRKSLFDPMTISTVTEMPLKNGKTIRLSEKGFLPAELKAMLETSGFDVLNIWGGTAGSWNREPLKMDEIEIMVVSRKAREIGNIY